MIYIFSIEKDIIEEIIYSELYQKKIFLVQKNFFSSKKKIFYFFKKIFTSSKNK